MDIGTRRGWMLSVTPRPRFTPGERTSGSRYTGGWVGLRAGLNTEVRGKILCLCRGSNLDRPVKPVARHYTAWATRHTLFIIIEPHVRPEILYVLIRVLCNNFGFWHLEKTTFHGAPVLDYKKRSWTVSGSDYLPKERIEFVRLVVLNSRPANEICV
jgi:hypothetical protein